VLNEGEQNAIISIYNAHGKEVFSFTQVTVAGLNRLEIDTQNWQSGLYTLKIEAIGYQKIFKVMVIK
jgi:hypothetical protein